MDEAREMNPFTTDDFSRLDDSDDSAFYAVARRVSHLDETALRTVSRIIGTLVVEEAPAILDLMASLDSHLPPALAPSSVVGLGLNGREMADNPALTSRLLHDLNRDPRLPFADGTFDAVLNTVSVDYLTRPVEVFREVARVLKRGGLFLVVFSNRMFPPKAVKIWRESSEGVRLGLVEEFFHLAGGFQRPRTFLSKGLPRPAQDQYAGCGIPSDPVYAVYAERSGGDASRPGRPDPELETVPLPPPEVVESRKRETRATLRCPYCGEQMSKWAVPQTPFTEWEVPYLYVCFNDACPYLLRGWTAMGGQGNHGFSYRALYNPWRDVFHPVPVHSLNALRDGIVE
ncbi:MAG: methyltransferase domain-containing protein [Acidobacteriota bacterium]